MKNEQEPNSTDKERLTSQPDSSNLKREGDIFMDENKGDNPPPEQPQQPTTESSAEPTAGNAGETEEQRLERKRREEAARKRAGASASRTERRANASDEGREFLDDLRQAAFKMYPDNEEARNDFIKKGVEAGRRGRIESRGMGIPESLEDLAELIMKREGEEWRTGEKALMEEGKLSKENFLDWVRSRMFAVHNFNPTSEVHFFGDEGMGIKTDYRTISFYEMVFTRSFWLERKKTGRNGEVELHHNKDNDALREQLLMEVFLFEQIRNGDLAYRMNRFHPENMPKVLTQIFSTNPLTRSNFMEFILSMPSMSRSSLGDDHRKEGAEMQTKQETNFYMGEGIRRAFATYMNIFDYEQLKKILGEGATLFRSEYLEYDSETGKPKIERGKQKIKTITLDPTEKTNRAGWFDANGKLRTDQPKVMEEYREYINIFTGPGPMIDQRRVAEVRERVVLSIMHKTGISYLEAKLAEAWAFSMTSFTGVAGKNDNRAIGFDIWTKLTRTRAYRERQMEEKRGGKFGKPQSVNGIKRIAVTFVEGARDVYGRPIYKIIQGGEGSHIDIDGTPVKNWVSEHRWRRNADDSVYYDLRTGRPEETSEIAEDGVDIAPIQEPLQFNADLQRQFVPNHIQTAINVYNFILDDVEINFPQLVTGYSRGKPLIDHDKLDKMKEGIEHDVRYVLSTWTEIDYGAKIVTWEAGKGGSDKPEDGAKSVEISILESMFGAEALRFIQAEIEARGLDAKNTEDLAKRIKVKDDKGNDVEVDLCSTRNDKFKIAVWKGVFMYLIAKEIEAHRTFGSGYKYYDLMDMAKTFDVLSHNPDPKNPDSNPLASKAEIKEIQKDTKTETSHLINQALRYWLAGGSASAFLAMIRTFIKTL